MIGKGEDWKAHRGSRDGLPLVAFYADRRHEVLKLRSGHRITLTYDLMLRGDASPRQEGDAGTVAELAGLLREHFRAPATHSWDQRRADPPSRLAYLLDHEYTPGALKWTRMKGAAARLEETSLSVDDTARIQHGARKRREITGKLQI